MSSEKLKAIKKVLEVKKRLEDCQTSEFDLLGEALTVINFLEEENNGLQDENYKLNQDLAQCENGYKLELHTARYQLFTVGEDLQRAEDKIDNLYRVLCNLRVQSRNEVVTRLRQLGERLKCKVLPFRCEGYAVHPFFFEIDKIVEEFIESYERKN